MAWLVHYRNEINSQEPSRKFFLCEGVGALPHEAADFFGVRWHRVSLEQKGQLWLRRSLQGSCLLRRCQIRKLSDILAYCDRLEYKYDVEMGRSIDVRRSMKSRIVTGELG